MLILKKFARDIPALIGLVSSVAVLIAIVGPWIAPILATSSPRICCSG